MKATARVPGPVAAPALLARPQGYPTSSENESSLGRRVWTPLPAQLPFTEHLLCLVFPKLSQHCKTGASCVNRGKTPATQAEAPKSAGEVLAGGNREGARRLDSLHAGRPHSPVCALG